MPEPVSDFDPDHSSTAVSRFNLALVFQDLGERAEARDLLTRAYAASLERLGPDHPQTKTIKAHWERFGESP